MQNLNKQFTFLKESRFNFIHRIAEHFPESEIFLVGGAVRDVLMGKAPNEYDFIVKGVPLKKLEQFLSIIGYTNLVGKNFGVIKFRPRGQKTCSHAKKFDSGIYDIALPRTDHSANTGGYRDVKAQFNPNLEIEKDLARRDFTINAMALEINGGIRLIDPYGGEKDIEKKIIQTVGKSEERFREDFSRMMRALRFACQLGFNIEKKTENTLKKMMTHINDRRDNGERIVPYETVSKEFLKSLVNNPICAMDLWNESGALAETIPELLKIKNCPQPDNWHCEGDVWAHTRLCFKKIFSKKFQNEFGKSAPSVNLLLAVLFHDIGKPYTIKTPKKDKADRIRFNEHDTQGAELFTKIAHRIRLSTVPGLYCDIEKTAWLIRHHLLLIHGPVERLKNTTIERYFFNSLVPGEDLIKLFWIDASATMPKDNHDTLISYKKIKERIKKLKETQKPSLPPPIIGGDDIMRELGLKPGQKVGELIELAREEQLKGKITTKEEALKLIKKLNNKP